MRSYPFYICSTQAKTSIMRTALILLCMVFLIQGASGQNYVTLYEDCNFRGPSATLSAGNYRVYEIKIGNDRLSCINIPYGFKVTIYEHDGFKGRSQTYTSSIACLPPDLNDITTSIVVESNYRPDQNPNDFVTFYADCYSKGYSRSLGAGTYTSSDLAQLNLNISSFSIYGNLRVRAYTTSENANGFNAAFEQNQACLDRNYNDKIRSLIVEYKPGNNGGYGGNGGNGGYGNPDYSNSFVTIYTNCNYKGNSLKLQPGNYTGDKLGLLKYDISAIELPNDLEARLYTNEYLSGNYLTVSNSISCLNINWNNRVASLSIQRKSGYGGNGGNGGYGNNNYNDQRVIIYSDGDYRGQSVSLLPGTYSSMSSLGFPDKALSSLRVPSGYRVIIYDRENFEGKSYTITQDKPGFYLSGWNDKTSSVKVYRDR